MTQPHGKVRYAVVGGGQIAQQAFMPDIAAADNSVLAALVTGDPVKADRLAGQYGIKAWSYEEYDALLASGTIDTVYIATPNFRHTDFTIRALAAGIHVLLEKPMAGSLAEAERILDAERAGNAKLMIAYRLHHEPGNVEMWTRARRGDFGTLRSFTSTFAQEVSERNSRGQHDYWTGPVPDMGTYPLNAVRNLFGAEPIAVQATGTSDPDRDFAFDDTVAVTLLFPDDRSAQFTVSYATASIETFSLVGTEATITASPCYTFGPDTAICYTEQRGDSSETHRFDPVAQFGGETHYFSDCILNDRRPEADGEEGWLDMRVLDAVRRALDTGKTITLEPASRTRRIEADQVRRLDAVEHPGNDRLISVVPISG